MLTTHCTYLCCQIMICMEITKIHQWQILSSLDHSSLIVHCSYTLKFLMLFQLKDSFLSNCYLLGSIIFNQHDDRLLLHSQSPPKKEVQKTAQCEIVLWSFCYTAGKHKLVSTAAHFWENILQVTGMSAWIE